MQQEAAVDAPTERFKSKFSNLKGDYNTKFQDGTILFLRFSDSKRPGHGSIRVQAELQNTA